MNHYDASMGCFESRCKNNKIPVCHNITKKGCGKFNSADTMCRSVKIMQILTLIRNNSENVKARFNDIVNIDSKAAPGMDLAHHQPLLNVWLMCFDKRAFSLHCQLFSLSSTSLCLLTSKGYSFVNETTAFSERVALISM